MFKISFRYFDKNYTATVQKIAEKPVRFIVSNITPYFGMIPLTLTFESQAEEDSLIYLSFSTKQEEVIRVIGETIFEACYAMRINIYK